MFQIEKFVLKNEIVAVVASLGHCGFGAIQAELYARTGRFVSPNSIRCYLGQLVAAGKIERFDYGKYCAPGKAPERMPVQEWVTKKLKWYFPDALTARQLRRAFAEENKYDISLDWLEIELKKLVDAGVLQIYPAGNTPAYAWANLRSAAATSAPTE